MELATFTKLHGEINEMKWCYSPQDGSFHIHCSKNPNFPLIYQNLKHTTYIQHIVMQSDILHSSPVYGKFEYVRNTKNP